MKPSAAPTSLGLEANGKLNRSAVLMAYANARLRSYPHIATKNLKRRLSPKRRKTPRPTDIISEMVTRRAAECEQELLDDVRHDRGVRWFNIIERKMHRLLNDYARQAKR